MAKIAYYVHGRGRGHAIRTSAVLPRLEKDGHELHVFGSGHSVPVLGHREDFQEVRLTGPGGGLVRALAERVPADLKRLRRLAPDIIVSDCDMSSVHVGAVLDIPSIAVGHGLLFGHAELPDWLSVRDRIREKINAASSSWPSWRKVIVHFGHVPIRTSTAVLARPDLRELANNVPTEDFVLTYFRDENGAHVHERLLAMGRRVVHFGSGSTPAGIETNKPSAEGFARALEKCTAVVASAGNHLPAECGMLGKPMLGLYSEADTEQRMNGALLRAAGLGMAESFERLDDETLNEFFSAQLPEAAGASSLRRMEPASAAIARLVAEKVGG